MKYKILPIWYDGYPLRNFKDAEFETKDELLHILGPLEDEYVYAYTNDKSIVEVNKKTGLITTIAHTNCDKLKEWFPFCLEAHPIDATPKNVYRLTKSGLENWEYTLGKKLDGIEFLDMNGKHGSSHALFPLDGSDDWFAWVKECDIEFIRNATQEDYQKYRDYVKREKEKE